MKGKLKVVAKITLAIIITFLIITSFNSCVTNINSDLQEGADIFCISKGHNKSTSHKFTGQLIGPNRYGLECDSKRIYHNIEQYSKCKTYNKWRECIEHESRFRE